MKRHRSDTNQKDIVRALQGFGAFVVNLNQVGDGCPDLAVYYHGWHLIEVKSNGPLGWKYMPAQKVFNKRCPVRIPVITNLDEVEKWAKDVQRGARPKASYEVFDELDGGGRVA
jgi:hypothetical protein